MAMYRLKRIKMCVFLILVDIEGSDRENYI